MRWSSRLPSVAFAATTGGSIEFHPDRRIGLCYVDAVEVNEWLVRQGWALNYEPYAKGRYREAEEDARKNRRGVWKGCFAAPWNVRHWEKDVRLVGSPCSPDARDHGGLGVG
jgi:endonuclease YncB( thermonuclease family)